MKFCETEEFRDAMIVDSDSETELYRIGSINLEDSVKESNGQRLCTIRGGGGGCILWKSIM